MIVKNLNSWKRELSKKCFARFTLKIEIFKFVYTLILEFYIPWTNWGRFLLFKALNKNLKVKEKNQRLFLKLYKRIYLRIDISISDILDKVIIIEIDF